MSKKNSEVQLDLIPPSGVKRITVSLPSSVVDDLAYISSLLGISRSALLSGVLGNSLPVVRSAVATLATELIKPRDGEDSTDVMKRYRSETRAIIDSLVGDLMEGGQDDLFKGK